MTATVRTLLGSDLRARYRLISVCTYRDGARRQKALQAAAGLARLVVLVVARRPELAHIHSSWGASFVRKGAAFAICRLARLPVVFHVHGGAFEQAIGGTGLRGALRRSAIRWVLGGARAVVVLTPGWAERIGGWTRIRRIVVVPNAPDLTVPVERCPSPPDQPLLMYLGHLFRHKGIFELIEATARLRGVHPGLGVVIAGTGPHEAEARARIAELGLDGVVSLPGYLDQAAKAALFARASCLVLPSYHEGLPLVLLEGMAAGVPAVATAVGGVPELADDGVHALLVPPRDLPALVGALGRLLADPALAERLTANGRRRVQERYTPEALATRVGAIYDSVLEDR